MNKFLKSALSESRKSGAKSLPTATQIESAKDGTSWQGVKSDGNPWSLIKYNENSYNCMC